MSRVLLCLLLPGCLLGVDPREDHGGDGDACETDFDCQRGFVCAYEYRDLESRDVCRPECEGDEDCDAGRVCDFDACTLEDS